MATNGVVAGKDNKSLAWMVRDEDLQELEDLKRTLLEKGDQARANGALYLSAQYTRLVALISPEIKRIRDRFDRETLAAVRKEEAALKLQARKTKQATQDSIDNA
jgi:hypothetical protein